MIPFENMMGRIQDLNINYEANRAKIIVCKIATIPLALLAICQRLILLPFQLIVKPIVLVMRKICPLNVGLKNFHEKYLSESLCKTAAKIVAASIGFALIIVSTWYTDAYLFEYHHDLNIIRDKRKKTTREWYQERVLTREDAEDDACISSSSALSTDEAED